METGHIQEFLTFAKCLNYSEAAKRSFVSTPTLTAHITGLETELGVQLVRKGNGKISLTPAGRELALCGHTVLDEVTNLAARVRHVAQSTVQVLMVSANTSEFDSRAMAASREYGRVYPDRKVQITPIPSFETGTTALEKHGADVAIHYEFSTSRHAPATIDLGAFVGTLAYVQELYFSVPAGSPLFTHDVLHLEDLEGKPIVYANAPSWAENYTALERVLKSQGVTVHMEGIDAENMLEYMLYQSTEGLSPVMASVVRQVGTDESHTSKVLKLEGDVFWNVYVVCRKDAPQAIADFVEVLASLPAPEGL